MCISVLPECLSVCGCQMPGNWIYTVVSWQVCAGNLTWLLWTGSWCSQLLIISPGCRSHLSRKRTWHDPNKQKVQQSDHVIGRGSSTTVMFILASQLREALIPLRSMLSQSERQWWSSREQRRTNAGEKKLLYSKWARGRRMCQLCWNSGTETSHVKTAHGLGCSASCFKEKYKRQKEDTLLFSVCEFFRGWRVRTRSFMHCRDTDSLCGKVGWQSKKAIMFPNPNTQG